MDHAVVQETPRRLDVLVGTWTLEAVAPDGAPWPGGGRSTFEWLASRSHLMQRSVIELPGAPNSVSIVGCDEANGSYTQLYSDDRGVCRISEMTFGSDKWTLERQGDPFPQRFVANISEQGNTIIGRWEKAEDGTRLTVDFDLTYRRVPQL